MAVPIGHEAHREFESLQGSALDIRNFYAVSAWAYENNKGALYDWLTWRGSSERYLRALEEGFEPTTRYFGIAVPVEERPGEKWVDRPLVLEDEEGVRYLALFSKYGNAFRNCTEWAALDESPAVERQEVTGEISPVIASSGLVPKSYAAF